MNHISCVISSEFSIYLCLDHRCKRHGSDRGKVNYISIVIRFSTRVLGWWKTLTRSDAVMQTPSFVSDSRQTGLLSLSGRPGGRPELL